MTQLVASYAKWLASPNIPFFCALFLSFLVTIRRRNPLRCRCTYLNFNEKNIQYLGEVVE